MFTKKSRRGFTTVELVIVIAVIAILAAALIPTFAGLIKSANHTADVQTATTLTKIVMMHAIENKITGPADLEEAIDEAMGEGYFKSLTPKSARYGYHFWYDANEQKIVLLSSEEILNKAQVLNPEGYHLSAIRQIALAETDNAINVSYFNWQTEITGGYYLLDAPEAGSLAYVLGNLGSPDMNPEIYGEVIKKAAALVSHKHDGEMGQKIADMLKNTAFMTNHGTFRYENVAQVTRLVIPDGTNELVAGVYTFNDDDLVDTTPKNEVCANVGGTLVIPGDVGNIDIGALIFEEDETGKTSVIVKIKGYTEDEITSILYSDATNATIILEEEPGATYYFDEGKLVKVTAEGEENLEVEFAVRNQVADFELSGNSNLFYAVDALPTDLVITAGGFVGVDASKPVSNTKINWSSNNDAVTVVDGVVTFTDAAKDLDTVTITAGAAYGDNVVKTVTINIVRITDFSLNCGDSFAYERLPGDTSDLGLVIGIAGYSYNHSGAMEAAQLDHTVTYTPSNEKIAVVNADGTVSFGGTFGTATITVSLKANPNIKHEVTVTFTEMIGDVLDKKWNGGFLYRVGNANPFSISNLYAVKDGVSTDGITYAIKVYDASKTSGDGAKTEIAASGSFYGKMDGTGLDATYKFTGTGVAIIEIQAIKNNKTVQTLSTAVEVVNAKNITTYTDLTSSRSGSAVLLNDITMASGSWVTFTNSSFYGNGFTFDVSAGRTNGSGGITTSCQISLNNSVLDNMIVKGAVYTEFGVTADGVNNAALVSTQGNSEIYNCVLTNSAAPVRIITGSLYIKNTVLRGGCYANLDIRGGQVTLENVTTVNNAVNNDKAADGSIIVGLGIAGWYESVGDSTKLTIKGTFKQYNWISEADKNHTVSMTGGTDYLDMAFNSFFGISGKVYTDGNGTKWMNTGIISTMPEDFNGDDIVYPDGYTGSTLAFKGTGVYAGVSKDVFALLLDASAPQNYSGSHTPVYEDIKPVFNFNGFSSQLIAKTEGALKYVEFDGTTLHIGVSAGNTVDFNFLTNVICTKYGKNLTVNVTYDGNAMTKKTFATTDKGIHTLVYSVEDEVFYDKDGNSVTKTVKYTEEINVSVEIASHKSAEISLTPGTTKYERTGYFWDYDWYLLAPVLEGLTITDYDEDGNAITVFTGGGTSIPNGLAITVGTTWNFPSSDSSKGYTEKISNDIYYIKGDKVADDKGTYSVNVTYSYKGQNGATVTFTHTFAWTSDTGKI